MRAVLLGLCLSAALAASNIELRSGGQTATITFDGATLLVPQQCRASTCSGIHDDIYAIRRDIAENTRFTESVRDALLAENVAARADMAEMRALLVAEDRARTAADAALRQEAVDLRARNAALTSELASAVKRLDTLQMRHTESVAALTKADEAAEKRLRELDQASRDADSVLKQSIERLSREQEADAASLAATDASMAQQSDAADAALRKSDAALAAKLASLADHSKSAHDQLTRAIAAVHEASEAAITALHDQSVDRDELLLDKTEANAQGVSTNKAAIATVDSSSKQRDNAIARTGQAAAKELASDVKSNAQRIAQVHKASMERDAALRTEAAEIGAAVERQGDDIEHQSQLSLNRDRTLREAIEAARDDIVAKHDDVLGRQAKLAQRADAIVEMVEDRAAAISNDIMAKHGKNAGRIDALDEKVHRNAEDIAADAKAALARHNSLMHLVNNVNVKLAEEQRLNFASFCALLAKMTEMDERLTGDIKGESLQRQQAVKRMMDALAKAVDEVVELQIEADVALASKLSAEVQSAVKDEAQARAAAINAERKATATKLAAKASLADMEKAIAAAQKEQGENVQRKLAAAEKRVNAAMADQRLALEAQAVKETEARHKQYELLRTVDLPALRKRLQQDIKERNEAIEVAMRAERVDAIAAAQVQVLSHVTARIDEITPIVSRALDQFKEELDALASSGLDEEYVQGKIAAATASLHNRIIEVNRDQKIACKEGYARLEENNGVVRCEPCPAGYYCTGGVRKRLYGAGSCAGAPKAADYTGTLYTGCKSDGSADNATDNTATKRCDRQIQCKYKESYSSTCPYAATCYKNCNCKNRGCCLWGFCGCNYRCDSCKYSCTKYKGCEKYRFVYRTP